MKIVLFTFCLILIVYTVLATPDRNSAINRYREALRLYKKELEQPAGAPRWTPKTYGSNKESKTRFIVYLKDERYAPSFQRMIQRDIAYSRTIHDDEHGKIFHIEYKGGDVDNWKRSLMNLEYVDRVEPDQLLHFTKR